MAKTAMKFYAVRHGHSTGVFDSWKICEPLVKGFAGAKFKSFSSRPEAEAFIAGNVAPAAAAAAAGGAARAAAAPRSGGCILGAPSRAASESSSACGGGASSKAARREERSMSSAASLAALPQGALLLYTDGGCDGNTSVASVVHPAGWGVVALEKGPPGDEPTKRAQLFGPVELTRSSPWFLGAEVASNNTGELCGVAHALLWLREEGGSAMAR